MYSIEFRDPPNRELLREDTLKDNTITSSGDSDRTLKDGTVLRQDILKNCAELCQNNEGQCINFGWTRRTMEHNIYLV